MGWDNVSPLAGIGLTDLIKIDRAKAPPLATALESYSCPVFVEFSDSVEQKLLVPKYF